MRPASPAAPRRVRGELWWVVAVAAVASTAWLLWQTRGLGTVTFDSFRDLAWAENMRAGRFLGDPVLAGFPAWYAPGIPLVVTVVGHLTSAATLDVCQTSVLWLNVLILPLLSLLVLRAVDMLTAIVVVPLTVVGSLWWMTHLAAPIPGVQGLVPALAALLCWQHVVIRARADWSRSSGAIWAGATGVLLALSFWVHPLCAGVAAAGVGGHGLGIALLARRESAGVRRAVAAWTGLAAGVALLLSAPLLVRIIALPKTNPAPFHYFAAELRNPDFALQMHAPLVLPLAAAGIWYVVRRARTLGWIVAAAAAAAVGPLSGYAAVVLGLPLPWVVPHEFQWHTQLFVCVLAAIGLVALGRSAARRTSWPRDRHLALLLFVVGGLVAALAPAASFLRLSNAYLLDTARIVAFRGEIISWLRTGTSIDDVVATRPLLGHLLVAGLTGRKCVAVPAGHMNPASHAGRRLDDLARLLDTGDEAEFLKLSRRYDVRWVLLEVSDPEGRARSRRLTRWKSTRVAFAASRGPGVVLEVITAPP